MRSFSVRPVSSLKGKVVLLGDKSIAHRCVILAALAPGKTVIENFPASQDCLSTISVFKKLGIKINRQGTVITVLGRGLSGLKKPRSTIFVSDSGTTLRLILGVLAGCDFPVRLIAGKSLSLRPMRRVTEPLRMMGAKITANCKPQTANREEYPPIIIQGGNLQGITYKMPVASAQVKSAILLAGLSAQGKTTLIEPLNSRDHTERLLKLFKADIKVNPVRNTEALKEKDKISNGVKENKVVIKGKRELVSPKRIYIPGDISSASFFIVAAAILPQAKILIKNVSLNPTRLGIVRVLRMMGADIKIQNAKIPHLLRQAGKIQNFEPMGDLIVKTSTLKGTVVKREEVPSLIDELPILMVAACNAKGRTVLEGVGELRVKETDRIRSMSENLKKMGADIRVAKTKKSENVVISGEKQLIGKRVRSFGDHRTAMSMIIAGLAAKGKTIIDEIACINKSFPEFTRLLEKLMSR